MRRTHLLPLDDNTMVGSFQDNPPKKPSSRTLTRSHRTQHQTPKKQESDIDKYFKDSIAFPEYGEMSSKSTENVEPVQKNVSTIGFSKSPANATKLDGTDVGKYFTDSIAFSERADENIINNVERNSIMNDKSTEELPNNADTVMRNEQSDIGKFFKDSLILPEEMDKLHMSNGPERKSYINLTAVKKNKPKKLQRINESQMEKYFEDSLSLNKELNQVQVSNCTRNMSKITEECMNTGNLENEYRHTSEILVENISNIDCNSPKFYNPNLQSGSQNYMETTDNKMNNPKESCNSKDIVPISADHILINGVNKSICYKTHSTQITNYRIMKESEVLDNGSCNTTLNITTHPHSVSKSSTINTPDCCNLAAWGLPPDILQKYLAKGVKTMFPWQVECLSNRQVLEDDRNLVYSAPTSAGKTLVAEILVIKTVLERQKKVIFILPFVSVVREKMFYFQDLLSSSGIRVEGFMGGNSPAGGFDATHIAIATIEKANSLVNRLMEDGGLVTLGAVVIDELHLIGDPHRGYLLELLLTKLKYMTLREEHVKVQLIGMSATLPNLSLLAEWLDAELYKTDFRPIPLNEQFKVDTNIYDNKLALIRKLEPSPELPVDVDNILQLCIETIADGHSVLIFCPTKNWCEKLSHQLATTFFKLGSTGSRLGQILREQLDSTAIAETLEQLKRCPVGLDAVLKGTVSFGVAFHHAGLTMDERDIIEGSFRTGSLRILVATSTLSSGVNLPARRVIIRSLMFHGKVLNTLTYKQMIGRAGRMGKDTAGESILICKSNERRAAEPLLSASLEPIKSCLQGSGPLIRALLEAVASEVAYTPQDVDLYSKCTLVSFTGEDNVENPTKDAMKFLVDNELILLQQTTEGEERWVATPLGKACLASSVPPGDGLFLFEELQRARKCFVLDTELHLIYLVTPFNSGNQIGQIDWMVFLELWKSLSESERRVGQLVGVEERFLMSAIRGIVKPGKLLNVHRRFYTALALHDLVREIPLTTVSEKYGCNRGVLQSLQQSASTFAGMVTQFCKQLGWDCIEILVAQFQARLQFGVCRELLDLLRLTMLNGLRARSLYKEGIKSVSELASADELTVERALYKALPFESEKEQDGEHETEAAKRNKMRSVFVTGRDGLTPRQAATMLVQEARTLVQHELGVEEVHWRQYEQDTKTKLQTNFYSHKSVPVNQSLINTSSLSSISKQVSNTKTHSDQSANEHFYSEDEQKNDVVKRIDSNKIIVQDIPINKAKEAAEKLLCHNEPSINSGTRLPNNVNEDEEVNYVNHENEQVILHQEHNEEADRTVSCENTSEKDRNEQHLKTSERTVDFASSKLHVKTDTLKSTVATTEQHNISIDDVSFNKTSLIHNEKDSEMFEEVAVVEPAECMVIIGGTETDILLKDTRILPDEVKKHESSTNNKISKTGGSKPAIKKPKFNLLGVRPKVNRAGSKDNLVIVGISKNTLPIAANAISSIRSSDISDSASPEIIREVTKTKRYDHESIENSKIINKTKDLSICDESKKTVNNSMAQVSNLHQVVRLNATSTVSSVGTLNDLEWSSFNGNALRSHDQSPAMEKSAKIAAAEESIPIQADSRSPSLFGDSFNLDTQVCNMLDQNVDGSLNISVFEETSLSEFRPAAPFLGRASDDVNSHVRSNINDSKKKMTQSLKAKISPKNKAANENVAAENVRKNSTDLKDHVPNSEEIDFSWNSASWSNLQNVPDLSMPSNKQNDENTIDPIEVRQKRVVKTSDQSNKSKPDSKITVKNVGSPIFLENINVIASSPKMKNSKFKSLASKLCTQNLQKECPMSDFVTPNSRKRKFNEKHTTAEISPIASMVSFGSSRKLSIDSNQSDSDDLIVASQASEPSISTNKSRTRMKLESTKRIATQKVSKSKPPRTNKESKHSENSEKRLLCDDENREQNISEAVHSRNLITSGNCSADNIVLNSDEEASAKKGRFTLTCKEKTKNVTFIKQKVESLQKNKKISSTSTNSPTNQNEIEVPPDWNVLDIINVAGNKRVFNLFKHELKQKTEVALALACDRFVKETAIIGRRIIGSEGRQKSQKVEGFVHGETRVSGVALSWGRNVVYYISLDSEYETKIPVRERLDLVMDVLSVSSLNVRCFACKDVYKTLHQCCNITPSCRFLDPKVAEWLMNPEARENDFAALTAEYFTQGVHLLRHAGPCSGPGGPGLDIKNTQPGRYRAAVEAAVTWHTVYELMEKLNESSPKLLNTFKEIEMRTMSTLARMELTGLGVNVESLQELSTVIHQEMSSLEQRAYSLAGRKFCFSSSKDVAQVLGMYRGRKVSTNKAILEHCDNPISSLVMSWRKLNSTQTKIVFPLLKLAQNSSRIRGCCVTNTVTGRVSMHDPNLQNVPRDFNSEDNSFVISVRMAFVPAADNIMLSADYCQLELRILAHYSQDPVLCDIMRGRGDVFKSIASSWNHIPEEEVDDNMRQRTKQLCYGMIYGMGVKTLAEQLSVTELEAGKFMETFMGAYPGVRRWLSKVVEKSSADGYVTTLTERRRLLPGINSEIQSERAQAARQAVNTKVQGSAADLAKIAMNIIEDRFRQEFPNAPQVFSVVTTRRLRSSRESHPRGGFLVLQLHDELLYEVCLVDLPRVAAIIKESMEQAYRLTVPLPVKIKVGPAWGDLIEYKP